MLRVVTLCFVVTGCGGDGDDNPTDTKPEQTGDAVVDAVPMLLEFVPIELGESNADFFTVRNLGGEKLTVTGLTFTGSAFVLIDEWDAAFELVPGAVKYVDIVYTVEGLEDLGTVVIHSDDPANPDLTVDLLGHGLIRELTITPDIANFGDIEVPCHGELELTFENTGNKQLSIDSYEFVTNSQYMRLDTLNVIPQPTLLNPGDSVTMIIDYLPEFAEAGVTGTLTVQTDTPEGEQIATQTAEGVYAAMDQGVFADPVLPLVDILFLIDNSCSMEGNNIDDITNGIPQLVNALNQLANWQMIVVNETNGCTETPILDSSFPNGADLIIQNAFTAASWSDALLGLASTSLNKSDPGECNDGILRQGATLQILVASDESEQSGVPWSTWVADYQTYVPRPDMVKVSGILDNNSCAAGSAGYKDAVLATGGALLNICDPFWGGQLSGIADTLTEAPPTFQLPPLVVPQSVVVRIDGVVTTDFLFEPLAGFLTVLDPAYIQDVSVVIIDWAVDSQCGP